MAAFTFGSYAFPVNPTDYEVPAIKRAEIGYALDKTMIANNSLYNQNEFRVVWRDMITDFNGIVAYLKSFIRNESKRNEDDEGPKLFHDHMGIYHGDATLVSAEMSMRKIGGSVAYTFTLVFRLN
jgi:hypothetical protein